MITSDSLPPSIAIAPDVFQVQSFFIINQIVIVAARRLMKELDGIDLTHVHQELTVNIQSSVAVET